MKFRKLISLSFVNIYSCDSRKGSAIMFHKWIDKKIEKTRTKMINIGLKEGLSSPKTIRISQKLDKLLVKYQMKYQNI
jgi:hypothetical protein